MSLFDLSGPEFLKLYGLLMAVAMATAFLLRWLLRTPGGEMEGEPQLDPYEIACIRQGAGGAVDTAIARLVHARALQLSLPPGMLKKIGPLPLDADGIETAVYAAAERPGGRALKDVRIAAIPHAAAKYAAVERIGLVMSDGQAWLARLLPAITLAIVGIIGFQKIEVGSSRGKPVGYLVMMTVAMTLIAVLFLGIRPLRTRRGSNYLRRLRDRHDSLKTSTAFAAERLPAEDFTMAVGLYGTAVLASTAYEDLHRVRRSSSATCGSSSCSSCGGGGGGSSCGGGGCGGGGCGGCGGGD